jgi:ketosteroid isomerase-like protein
MVAGGNVEAVKRIFESINDRDVDGVVVQLDPDFELDSSRSINPDLRGVHRGREAAGAALRSMLEPWEEFEMYVDGYIEHGDNVIRHGGIRARGRGSGVAIEAKGAQVWEFRDGKPVAARQFQTQEEALRFAGIEAEADE